MRTGNVRKTMQRHPRFERYKLRAAYQNEPIALAWAFIEHCMFVKVNGADGEVIDDEMFDLSAKIYRKHFQNRRTLEQLATFLGYQLSNLGMMLSKKREEKLNVNSRS